MQSPDSSGRLLGSSPDVNTLAHTLTPEAPALEIESSAFRACVGSGAPAPHAPHRPCSRATPGAGQLRRTEGRVGGDCGRHPTGPPPPGRRGWVPVGRSGAPPRRAPHVYDDPPPPGAPRPAWDDLIAAFHDHGILPDDTWQEVRQKALGRDYRRRVRARLLELRDPLRQRWDDLCAFMLFVPMTRDTSGYTGALCRRWQLSTWWSCKTTGKYAGWVTVLCARPYASLCTVGNQHHGRLASLRSSPAAVCRQPVVCSSV